MFASDGDWGNPEYFVVKANGKYVKKLRRDYSIAEMTDRRLDAVWLWRRVADKIAEAHRDCYDKIKIVKIRWWNILWWWLRMEEHYQ